VDDNDTLISVNEAAQLLNRSIEQVRRYLREGKLVGQRIGGQWFIEMDAVTLYPKRSAPERSVGEVAAMEYKPRSDTVEALLERINANREAIRARIGGDLRADVVEMVREDREAH
jgi:excisionase family DNA binding protein